MRAHRRYRRRRKRLQTERGWVCDEKGAFCHGIACGAFAKDSCMSRWWFSTLGYPSGLTGSEHPHTPLMRFSLGHHDTM